MSKDYKGYELIKEITEGNIKEGTTIGVFDLSVCDIFVTNIVYKNKKLLWLEGKFDTSYLLNPNCYFRIVEEQKEIDKLEIDENGFIHTNNGTWKGRKLDVAFAKAINKLVEEVENIKEK